MARKPEVYVPVYNHTRFERQSNQTYSMTSSGPVYTPRPLCDFFCNLLWRLL